MDGGGGADRLTGGFGADSFYFAPGAANDAGNTDRITDFQNDVDTLVLSRALFADAALKVAGVLARYATFSDGVVTLTFGTDVLHVSGLTSTAALQNDILLY